MVPLVVLAKVPLEAPRYIADEDLQLDLTRKDQQ
jgi:hypothetical protein